MDAFLSLNNDLDFGTFHQVHKHILVKIMVSAVDV